MKFNILPEQFEELIKKSYNLDIIYLLKLVEQQYDVTSLREESMRIAAIYQALIRKGLITENDELTTIGKDLLEFLDAKISTKILKRKPASKEFEEWWEVFPSNDKFEYKGVSFRATRAFKAKKEDCKLLFNKYINENLFTAHEMIEATKYDVQLKKENSVNKRQNQLTYLQNSYTYIYQKSFQGYIDLIKEGVEIIETKNSYDGTNI